MKRFETSKLIIRDVEMADNDFILKLFSHEKVTEHLHNNEPMTSVDEAIVLCKFYTQPEPTNQHRWILCSKEIGRRVGTIGYHSWRKEQRTVRIGFDIYPKHWHEGYMKEALPVILNYMKENMDLRRIEARISPDNLQAIKMVEKNGFVDSGERVTYSDANKDYVHYVYVLNLE